MEYDKRDALEYLAEADEVDRQIIDEIRDGSHETIEEIAQVIGISRATLYRRIEAMKKELKKQGWR